MTLNDLRQQARIRFGLDGAPDALYTDAVMTAAANHSHRRLARAARCYEATKTVSITLGSAGISVVTLPTDVFEVQTEPGKVRALLGGSWRDLVYRTEQELTASYGVLDGRTNGTPWAYFLRAGNTDDAHRELVLFPGSTSALSNALKVPCFVYPADLAADGDKPELQPAEHDLLLPGMCRHMAEIEHGRALGTAGGDSLTYWRGEEAAAGLELADIIRRYRRRGPRRVRSAYRTS